MTDSVKTDESLCFAPPVADGGAAMAGLAAYESTYERSIQDPEAFWREAAQSFHWFDPPKTIVSGTMPQTRWFEDGTTNMAFNCLDRHVAEGRGNQAALIWEGEPGEVRTFTYRQLLDEVCRAANVLHRLGVRAGDRVGIYLGMVPEAFVAMLACARIGAIHTVVFGGFASDALADRLIDAGARLVITQDGAFRRGAIVPLKANLDAALSRCPTVEHVLVVRRTLHAITMAPNRDLEWRAELDAAPASCPAAALLGEHPLFILYTSGTTGQPKGVLHTTAGYMVGTAVTAKYVFDLRPSDVYFCTADVGWVTGHSYVVYAPLTNGATVLIYEGAPNTPDEGRMWDLIERHRVSIFYTAPTAIRSFIRWGDHHPQARDLSSLRLLGSVGEPINPEAWLWYRRVIGRNECPVVDTWWQTETGAIMLSPLPYVTATKPGSCAKPLFGVAPKIVREDGSDAAPNESGLLVIEQPWPSMARTIWGDDARFRDIYFGRFAGKYLTGDGARCDEDGYFWVVGRVDDVLNVAGHRLGTAEIESALVAHAAVAEAAAVGRPDDLKGTAVVVFVTLKSGQEPSEALRAELLDQVSREIGKFARPDAVRFAPALPKTRSGKIVRRLLKDIVAGRVPSGDLSTLEDPAVLDALRDHP